MTVYTSFKHFCQTLKYNEVDWLLLMSLDQIGKEKHEFRDLDSQLKHLKNDLKACVLKESLISYRQRAEIAGNQTQNLILGSG